MKRFFALLIVLVVILFPVMSLEVNETELESIGNPDIIEFINYTGPQAVINTIDEIKSIGSTIGEEIAPKTNINSVAGNQNKYYVIHAIDDTDSTKFNADIFIIGNNATVDHIRLLRTILASYLTSAYDYSEQDANTLATFITVYNAVYRGNISAYEEKYKPVVISNLDASKVGISVNYQDWPGQTQLVIPLRTPTATGISTIDTTIISDTQVVQSMREEDNRGVDERKNMVDLKEREADVASEKAQEAQKEAVVAQKTATDDKEALVQATREEQQAQKEAETKAQVAAENPNNQQAQTESKQAQETATQATEKRQEAETKAQESSAIAQEKKEEATTAQQFADVKRTEAQTERTSIASDQQQNIADAIKESNMVTTYGLKLVNPKDMLSALVLVDTKTGKMVKESPVQVIRNRTIYFANDNYVAIAGQNTSGNTAVKLVLLDKTNMEIIAQSIEDVSENSVLAYNDGYFYVVVKSGTNWIIAKYADDLRLQAKSTINVLEATPITASGNNIVITDSNGVIKMLSTKDLSEVIQ